jgi:hypothetical protein
MTLEVRRITIKLSIFGLETLRIRSFLIFLQFTSDGVKAIYYIKILNIKNFQKKYLGTCF